MYKMVNSDGVLNLTNNLYIFEDFRAERPVASSSELVTDREVTFLVFV